MFIYLYCPQKLCFKANVRYCGFRFMRSEIACPLRYIFSCRKISFELCEVPRKAFLTKKNCDRTVVVFSPDAYNWAQTARFHFCRRYRRLNTTLIFHFVSTPFTFLLLSVGPKYIAPSLTVDLMDQVRYGESIDSVCA